jgi:hypothetical protein
VAFCRCSLHSLLGVEVAFTTIACLYLCIYLYTSRDITPQCLQNEAHYQIMIYLSRVMVDRAP